MKYSIYSDLIMFTLNINIQVVGKSVDLINKPD
jgi:hypothetical protein